LATKISELASRTGFKGTPQHRIAEPSSIKTLPPIDNTIPGKPNIRTSVDCYVSGQYVQKKGKILEVTQRYQIFVSYSHATQLETMKQLRELISNDFRERYERSFNISTVFIPELRPPAETSKEQKPAESMEIYGGSRMFRSITRYQRARFDIGTQRLTARSNIENIRKRYGLR
jgi:hypothetical protein